MGATSPRSPSSGRNVFSPRGHNPSNLDDVFEGAQDITERISSRELQKLVVETETLVSNERYRKTKWYPWSTCYDFSISFGLVLHSTFSMETITVLIAAVASTLFFHYYRFEGSTLATDLDFTLVGAAIVFPVSFLINSTFQRREKALFTIASSKALLTNLCTAYCLWNWNEKKGRAIGVPADFYEEVQSTLGDLLVTHRSMLRLPTNDRAWYKHSESGRNVGADIDRVQLALRQESDRLFTKLHILDELLKCGGIASAESSRIEQYIQLLQKDMEILQVIKEYRTPQVTRSLLRVFVVIIPVFYGSYYASVASVTNLGFGLALSILTAWVLCALVHIQRTLEDPFFIGIISGKHIPDELDTLYERFETIITTAKEYEAHQGVVELT